MNTQDFAKIVKADFREILKQEKKMLKQENNSDNYWAEQRELKEMLMRMAIRDFRPLTKTQLMKFLSLCSSHRPLEPFKILVYVGQLNDRTEKGN